MRRSLFRVLPPVVEGAALVDGLLKRFPLEGFEPSLAVTGKAAALETFFAVSAISSSSSRSHSWCLNDKGFDGDPAGRFIGEGSRGPALESDEGRFIFVPEIW